MPVFDSKPERNNNPPRRENNSSNRKKEGGTEENPMELRMKAIQRVFRSRGMDFDSFFKKNETEPENKALESEADQVADNVVAKKQGNESNPNNIKPQNHLVIQRQTEKGGDKGGGKPESKQGKDLIVELPDFREMLNVEGRGTVYLGRSFLVYADTSKPLCVENASPSIDPHLRYHREFKVVTEDGRTIYLMIQGRTASAESKSASINDQGQSSFAYRLIVERSDGKQVWKENRFDEYTDNSSIFQIISGIQEINPILFLPRKPDELFLNTIISEADKMLPGFPKRESAPEKGWGADDYEGNEKDVIKVERPDTIDPKSWSEMTEPERKAKAWKAFKEEFSWDRVAKETAMVLAVALGMYIAEPLAPVALGALSLFAIYSGVIEIVQPYLDGASPEVLDWIHGGFLVVIGASTLVIGAFLAGYTSAGAAATASAIAVLGAIGLAIASILKTATNFDKAVAAPNEAEMQKLARKSAHNAEQAIVETLMTLPIIKQVKDIFSGKSAAPAEEVLQDYFREQTKKSGEKEKIKSSSQSEMTLDERILAAVLNEGGKGVAGDPVFLQQKKIVAEVTNGRIELNSNARKGNFGEIAVDVDMQQSGWTAWHERITDIDAQIKKGIDHVFRKDGPPPVVIVNESKFGTATLKKLVNGTRQMSEAWIEDRLFDTVGEKVGTEIISSGYKAVLARISPDGKINYSLLDRNGKVISTIIP